MITQVSSQRILLILDKLALLKIFLDIWITLDLIRNQLTFQKAQSCVSFLAFVNINKPVLTRPSTTPTSSAS